MKLIAFKGRRQGFAGIGNALIVFRLRGEYSHCELMFEPGDGVAHLMPDGSDLTDEHGALWCASSVAVDPMPDDSPRRPGRKGGVRFKRIAVDADWDVFDLPFVSPVEAAERMNNHLGALYDWQQIVGFLSWVIPGKSSRWMCSEICAHAMGLTDPARFDPCSLVSVAHLLQATAAKVSQKT